MAYPGTSFMLQYTKEEWQILSEIAGGDARISQWLNCRLHEFCKEEFEPIDNEQSILRKGYGIPVHLTPYVEYLCRRFNQRPATIIRRFITEPYLLRNMEDVAVFGKCPE